MRYRQPILFILLVLCIPVFTPGQVPNDNISQRIRLKINEPHQSATVNCTVEWECLNQRLTSSCIKYHNDQWFSLNVPDRKPYFINVSSQECRDIWGVQVVVLAGEACNPRSYALLRCYSDGNTDDIFIRLPELDPGREYLVNVDGYLHDLCSFSIELSDTPRGLPLALHAEADADLNTDRNLVVLEWNLTAQMAMEMVAFEVFRSAGNGQPYERIADVYHETNAFGAGRRKYIFYDTLERAEAAYKVVGQTGTDRILLLYEHVHIDPQLIRDDPANNLEIHLNYTAGEPLAVLIYDQLADSLLLSDQFSYNPSAHRVLKYPVGPYRKAGISTYRVVVIRKNGWIREEFLFSK